MISPGIDKIHLTINQERKNFTFSIQENGITNETFRKISDEPDLLQPLRDSLYTEIQHFIYQAKKANSDNSSGDNNTQTAMDTEEEEAPVFVQPIASRTKRKIFQDYASPSQTTPTSSPSKKKIHSNITPP